MPSPSALLRLACLAFLPLAAVARSVGPYMQPRDANTTLDGLIQPKPLTFSVNCSLSGYDYGHGNGVLEGFHYLMNRGGIPGNDPESCGRISCAHDTGIRWCNDDKTNRKQLESYQVIARAVMEVFQQKPCWQNFDDDNYMEAGVRGKTLVDGEDWSVWVVREDCSVPYRSGGLCRATGAVI